MATQTLPTSAEKPVKRSVGEGAVIRAEHLTKRFGDVLAVDDLSFALQRGTVTGFLGPNGAGKTTTLRMLLHLVQPTSGQALVFGGHYQDLERPAIRVGAVLEAADFHPGRSGRVQGTSCRLRARRRARRRQLVPWTRTVRCQARRHFARSSRARERLSPPSGELFARNAAAACARGRAARQPRAADP